MWNQEFLILVKDESKQVRRGGQRRGVSVALGRSSSRLPPRYPPPGSWNFPPPFLASSAYLDPHHSSSSNPRRPQALEIRLCDSHMTGRVDIGSVRVALSDLPDDGDAFGWWLPVQVSRPLRARPSSGRGRTYDQSIVASHAWPQ